MPLDTKPKPDSVDMEPLAYGGTGIDGLIQKSECEKGWTEVDKQIGGYPHGDPNTVWRQCMPGKPAKWFQHYFHPESDERGPVTPIAGSRMSIGNFPWQKPSLPCDLQFVVELA